MFTRTHWVDNQPPSVNAEQLNRMEVGIEQAHQVGFLNVRWFESAGDDYAMIQAALDEAVERELAVYIPAGEYRLRWWLRITGPTVIFGDGIGKTVLVNDGTHVGSIFSRTGVVGSHVTGISVRDMTLDGANSAIKGFNGEWVNEVHFERVEFKNFTSVGFDIGNTVDPDDDSIRNTGVTVADCIFSGNNRDVEVQNAESVSIRNNRFTNVVYVITGRRIRVTDNEWRTSGSCLWLGNRTGVLGLFNVSDNQFHTSSTQSGAECIRIFRPPSVTTPMSGFYYLQAGISNNHHYGPNHSIPFLRFRNINAAIMTITGNSHYPGGGNSVVVDSDAQVAGFRYAANSFTGSLPGSS